MTGGERDNPDQPDHDRLPDYEIDLTGVVEQTDSLLTVISDAIIEAGDDREVPEWGARVMARWLANRLPEPNSALHHFAVTGRIDHPLLAQELADLWLGPRDDFTSEVISRLGTYLLAGRQAALTARHDTHPEQVQARIDALGPAFAAFLTLPDVDPDTAEATFHDCYYNSFASLREIVETVADDLEVWRRITEASLEHMVSPDPHLLLAMASERWDIVAHHKRYYLFEK